jgi:hypothetical protein
MSWPECAEIGTLVPSLWKYEIIYPLWKTVWQFLKKLTMKLSYDLAKSNSGYIPKITNSGNSKGICMQK